LFSCLFLHNAFPLLSPARGASRIKKEFKEDAEGYTAVNALLAQMVQDVAVIPDTDRQGYWATMLMGVAQTPCHCSRSCNTFVQR
jgi:hypothetical protein